MVRTISLFFIFIFIGCEMNSKQIIKPEKFTFEIVKFNAVSKTLYNGGKLDAEIAQAEARLRGAEARLLSAYREGLRGVENAQKTIESMEVAILLSEEDASAALKEIDYLRKQLVIGGSSLDTVLSAEARLYQAESKAINFLAEKRKSQLFILSALGLISTAIGMQF